MTSHSKLTTEQQIQKIIKHEMVDIKKMKKAELLILVQHLMGDVLRELDDYSIDDMSAGL